MPLLQKGCGSKQSTGKKKKKEKKRNHLDGAKFHLSGHSELDGIPDPHIWISFVQKEIGLKNNYLREVLQKN